MELLGRDGARGLSHPKVDDLAGVPPGSTSFYFRTRHALLQGVATRLTELDVADLSQAAGLGDHAGTAGLAELVMISATEPWLTRAKARYELALHASRDPDLGATLQQATTRFRELARDVVAHWHPEDARPAPALIDEQAAAVLTYINGVMMSFVTGGPVVSGAEQLERLIRAIITAVGEDHTKS
ncbi:TetR/AcrR family transcriptional regulator [Mycobacterium sp. pUA109]|uniref:TetR/AcrR family transcriptional regulator n=1 Tax=Mycobacterium sp. pUA109 TaxID=3238982 RepID=UPI00351B1B27